MMMDKKNCLHCQLPLENKRKNYHEECLKPAKEAAKILLRQCKRCKRIKAPSSYSDDSSRIDGKFPWCKTCQTEYLVGNKFQDSEGQLNGNICPVDQTPIRGHKNRRFCSNTCKNKVASLRKNYNLTFEQYQAMVEATGGRCPICGDRVRKWNVDHNHKTRKVTGVVCTGCNVGSLAFTYHDVEYVKRLLAYLENPPADQVGIETLVPEAYNKPSSFHKVWKYKVK
jgi:hypothetical protein